MKNISRSMDFSNPGKLSLLLLSFLAFSVSCKKLVEDKFVKQNLSEVILVSNDPAWNPAHPDSSLINAWGLAWAPSGIAWVNSQAGHQSNLYSGEGVALRAGIKIPSPADSVGGNPTGIVFNNVKGFTLPDGKAANFLFDGVDAVLSGWNGPAGANAFRIGVGSTKSSYTGLALAASNGVNYLYAANFGAGTIDVWDTGFVAVTWMSFKDPHIPTGYSPFNIQTIGSWLYVTYAKVGPTGRDQAGVGNGYVDIFNTDGSLVKRFASKNFLNAPWGIVEAPANFLVNMNNGNNDDGDHGGNNSGDGNNGGNNNSGDGKHGTTAPQPAILIGNFGDGRINVYSLDGNFLGLLASHDQLLVIDGLWALSFAPTTSTIDPGRLYFTAGPNGEKDGVFGYLLNQ
jgi:uncharacterized protein (TIGR03118 family)